MKKWKQCLAGILALMVPDVCAGAEDEELGRVTAGKRYPIVACMDGMYQGDLSEGEYLQAGESVGEIEYTAVYAPESGRIAAIFLEEGDETENAQNGVLVIEPESEFVFYATAENAYESVETMYPHLGQIVYLRCAANGTHRGYGRITQIDGLEFVVEGLGGEFYNGESVYVYLEEDCESSDRIGRGTAIKPLDVTVTAQGILASLEVSPSQTVQTGQLLFTVAPGAEPGQTENSVKSPAAGYVTEVLVSSGEQVQAGQILAYVCPAEELVVEFALGREIARLEEGEQVTLWFDLGDEDFQCSGEIAMISYIPVSGEEEESTAAQATPSENATARNGETASIMEQDKAAEQGEQMEDASETEEQEDSDASAEPRYKVLVRLEEEARIVPGMRARLVLPGET